MALPTVVINSTGGSDTAASGAGLGTALSGTGASTAASTTVTLLADNPNLAGVATDGSAVLWVGSSSGRQFSKITGVNNTAGVKTVTVAVAYANTESGKNWGIGGKRATLAGSARLLQDWAPGWVVDQQSSEVISATITVRVTPDNTNNPPTLTSSTFTTWGTQPVISTTTNSLVMFDMSTDGVIIRNLSFKQTSGTPGVCMQPINSPAGLNLVWSNCIFDGFLSAIDGSNVVGYIYKGCTLDCCEVKNCTQAYSISQAAVSFNNTTGALNRILNCYLHDNVMTLTSNLGLYVMGNVFANNNSVSTTTAPMHLTFQDIFFKNNTIYNCGSDSLGWALGYAGTTTAGNMGAFENNIFYGCPGYGIGCAALSVPSGFLNRNNAYGGNNGNSSGLNVQAFPAGIGDVTLTASPFVSTVTPDYGLNATAGGGAACRNVAATVPGASANVPGDLGAVPSGGGASAGTPTRARVFAGM